MTMQTIDLPCESQDRRWEKYKSTIIQLYMHEGYTLHKVMEIMESRYNFKARPKLYKSRLRKWGCRKNIVLKNDQEKMVIGELATATTPDSHTTSKLLILPNGQIVDTDRLAKHLSRKWTTRGCNSTYAIPLLKAVRPPDVFYVPETLYRNTRGYILGRFDEMNTLGNPEAKRGSNPHTLRWVSFAYGVHVAVVDRRYDDAILCLRNAPNELMNLLLHQPGLVLSNLFRFITSIIRFLPQHDPGAQQFLTVIKSLLRYGATCLGNAETGGKFPSTHPIRLVLENLARVEDKELLMVARRAWMVACLAAFDLMGQIAAANANKDWITTTKNGGRHQLPPSHQTGSDHIGRANETNGQSHMRLVTLMNRAFFLRTLAASTGQERSLEESVLEALQRSDKAEHDLDEKSRLTLHKFFGLPLDNIASSRLVDFLAASPA